MRRDRSGRQAAGCAPDDALLLDVARHSIERGLAVGQAEPVDLADCPAALRKPGACFVTLRGPAKELRGCIGTLEPHRSLVEDVAGNAYAAAFHDPRMEVVTVEEIADLQIEISLLGPLVELAVRSFEDLLARPQTGRDGLVLEDCGARATLLPQVWSHFTEPREFVGAVWQKAGLPADHWSASVRAWRYEVRSIQEPCG